MTEPPSGWSTPGDDGERQPVTGEPPLPGSTQPPYYGQPTPGYTAPPYYGQPTPGYTAPPYYGQPTPGYGGPEWAQPAQAGGWNPQPGWGQVGYGAPPVLQPGVVPLRPLALGELLDGAIKIIQRYPKPTLGLSALIALFVTVTNVLIILAFDSAFQSPTFFSDSSTTAPEFDSGAVAQGAASVPAGIVGYLAGLVLTGALVAVVGRAVLGQPAPAAEIWAAVKPRLLGLLGLSLLTGLLLVAGPLVGIGIAVLLAVAIGPVTLVVGIPLGLAGFALSVYLFTRLALAAPALVLEKASITGALRRSGVLVKGAWWRTFGVLLLASFISSVVAGIISIPISLGALAISGFESGGSAFAIAQVVGGGLASVLLAPFSAGVRALLYVDRRMRAEGLDVALQAAAATGIPA